MPKLTNPCGKLPELHILSKYDTKFTITDTEFLPDIELMEEYGRGILVLCVSVMIAALVLSQPSTSLLNNFFLVSSSNADVLRITTANLSSSNTGVPLHSPASISSLRSRDFNGSNAPPPSSLPVVHPHLSVISPSLPPLPLPKISPSKPSVIFNTSSGNACSGSTSVQKLIPGAKFATASATASFLDFFSCLCRNGTWQRNNTPRFLPWPVPRPPTAALETCDFRHIFRNKRKGEHNVAWGMADGAVRNGGKESDWLVRPGLKYEWVVDPTTCMAGNGGNNSSNSKNNEIDDQSNVFLPAWQAVSPDSLIDRLAGKELLIVGDSISGQVFWSLRNFLLQGSHGSYVTNMSAHRPDAPKLRCADVIPYPPFCQKRAGRLNRIGHLKMCVQVACEGGFSLTVLRSDWLSLGGEWGLSPKHAMTVPWMEYVRQQGDKIAAVVMNRGAHYVADERLIPEVNATLSAVREALPNTLLIYRSTVPGHADCWNFSKPLSSPQPLSSLPESFHWGLFPHQNELVRPLVEAVGGLWWDVTAMTALRADGHRLVKKDCLHYCSPGPVDTWSKALYNLLMQALP